MRLQITKIQHVPVANVNSQITFPMNINIWCKDLLVSHNGREREREREAVDLKPFCCIEIFSGLSIESVIESEKMGMRAKQEESKENKERSGALSF